MQSITLWDIPCSLAGNMRRTEYLQLRDTVMGAHQERARLMADLREMASARRLYAIPSLPGTIKLAQSHRWQHTARSILGLQEFCAPESDLIRKEKPAWLRMLDKTTPLSLSEVETIHLQWMIIFRERKFLYNNRLIALHTSFRALRKTWKQFTVPGFKRHLKSSDAKCDCFLCLGEFSLSATHNIDQCYICSNQNDSVERQSELRMAMCRSCLATSLANGLCGFCYGKTESGACKGRDDLRKAASYALSLASSDTDILPPVNESMEEEGQGQILS